MTKPSWVLLTDPVRCAWASAEPAAALHEEQADDAVAVAGPGGEELEHSGVVGDLVAGEEGGDEAREVDVAGGDGVGVAQGEAEEVGGGPGADAAQGGEDGRRCGVADQPTPEARLRAWGYFGITPPAARPAAASPGNRRPGTPPE
jgi:hypothetical protein